VETNVALGFLELKDERIMNRNLEIEILPVYIHSHTHPENV